MSSNITKDAVGKSVFNADDEKIGIVVEVDDGTAYVEPDPSITESYKAKLGWGNTEADEEAYPLDDDSIEAVNEGDIELRTHPES